MASRSLYKYEEGRQVKLETCSIEMLDAARTLLIELKYGSSKEHLSKMADILDKVCNEWTKIFFSKEGGLYE